MARYVVYTWLNGSGGPTLLDEDLAESGIGVVLNASTDTVYVSQDYCGAVGP